MELPKRKLTRLNGYDYSLPNYYFVTICTKDKRCIFGDAQKLNVYGKIVKDEIMNISKHFDNVEVDKYVVMPNHIHAILIFNNAERSRPFPTLSTVIGLYKSGVSKEIHKIDSSLDVWQKSFYDKIIRNEKAYQAVCQYIDENPLKWKLDKYYKI